MRSCIYFLLLFLLSAPASAGKWNSFSRYREGGQVRTPGQSSVLVEMRVDHQNYYTTNYCGGVLIGTRVLTNAHCIPSTREYRTTIFFDWGYRRSQPQMIDCKVVDHHFPLDYAVLDCPEAPDLGEDRVRIASQAPEMDEPVFVVQHNCPGDKLDCREPKKVSTGEVLRTLYGVPFQGAEAYEVEELFHITAYIEAGSSGSPVFNAKGELVGLVNGFSLGRERKTSVIPIDLILEHIER